MGIISNLPIGSIEKREEFVYYISDEIKYTLRKDLCKANENFESCFVEIDNPDTRNTLIGVVYRSHTAIDHLWKT